MKRHPNSSDKYDSAIRALRRVAREAHETPEELVRLRHRITSERARTHRQIIEQVAKQAGIDLEPILEDARRRNAIKRRYVTETFKPLEARIAEQAKAEKARLHEVRSQYLKSLGGHAPLLPGAREIKLHSPIQWSSLAKAATGPSVSGGWCSVDLGTFEATAEVVPPGEVGVWLHSYIYSDSGDSEDTTPARTFHELTYQSAAPTSSFLISAVRVDLVGNGVASSSLGDYGWPDKADPLWEHSFVQLDVYIAQLAGDELQECRLLSDKLFSGKGAAEARQIRSLLSGQTYSANVVLRKPAAGGGDVLCYVHVTCSAQTQGSDGRVLINLRAPDHGIFIGGITLLGYDV